MVCRTQLKVTSIASWVNFMVPLTLMGMRKTHPINAFDVSSYSFSSENRLSSDRSLPFQ
jgi:hypothetical protein